MRLADRDRSRAVLIGTAGYGERDLPDLPAVAYNLFGLSRTLCDPRFAILARPTVTIVADPTRPHATGVAVARAADEAEDLMLVYLAGHLWLDLHGEPRLALARDERGTRAAILELAWVLNSLAECTARAKVLVLDVRLNGGQAGDPDASELLAHQCALGGRIAVWAFAVADLALYNQPGGTGTTFTAALLDVVQRPHDYFGGLTLPDLHTATATLLRRQRLPEPVLCLDPPAKQEASLVLFHQSSAAPAASDLDAFRSLLDMAGRAERDFRHPNIVVQTYRSIIVEAQRLHGPDHEVTLRARHQLAHWIGMAGDFQDAAYLYQCLWDDQRRVLHPGHPDLSRTETAISYWSRRR